MAHSQRRNRVVLVLGLLIACLLGVQAGRMSSTRFASSADTGVRPTAAEASMVLKRIGAGFLPTEAQAAEPPGSGVVRKKLPESTPTPAVAPVAPPQKADEKSVEPKPDGALAAPPNVVLKKVPEPPPPPAPAVAASPPADAPAAVTAEVAPGKPDEPKPAVAEVASPVPAPAPAAAPPAVAAPAPPPAPAARAATKADRTPGLLRYPYSILLASCQDRRNAEAALATYRRLGLAPYVVQTDLGSKGVWWRTLSGAYSSYDEALAAKQGPKMADAVVVKTPYANLVGEYGTEAEANAAAAALARKGLFPYLLKGPASVQLFTGAFQAQAAAEEFRRELESFGVPARTVQR